MIVILLIVTAIALCCWILTYLSDDGARFFPAMGGLAVTMLLVSLLFGWSEVYNVGIKTQVEIKELRILTSNLDCYPISVIEDVIKLNKFIESWKGHSAKKGFFQDQYDDNIDTLYLLPMKNYCK